MLRAVLLLLAGWIALPSSVMFRSEESHTASEGPIYNEIRLISEGPRDIWIMRQRQTSTWDRTRWDRLAIVVDRDSRTAEFRQLAPGALGPAAGEGGGAGARPLAGSDGAAGAGGAGAMDWLAGQKQVQFRVACTLCHANGPRVIRPAPAEGRAAGDWLRTALWNLKIKSYPRLTQVEAPFERTTRLEFRGEFAHTPLKVATCVFCHREDGPVARGTLRRENSLAIQAMVANGHMPPLGIPLPASQREELEKFLKGF